MVDGIDYKICQTQGRIYELIADNGYDVPLFSSLFLQSDFCRRSFDTIYSRFQLADELECMDFIIPEIQDRFPGIKSNPIYTDGGAHIADDVPIEYFRKYPDTCFSPDVAYWIGFTYRQLYIETGTYSSELAERLSFGAMCRYYPGLHTVDEDMATDIICENFGLVKIQNFPQEGE